MGAGSVGASGLLAPGGAGVWRVLAEAGRLYEVLQHLLRLRGDDPQLARLAAAAILVAEDCRGCNVRTYSAVGGAGSTSSVGLSSVETRRRPAVPSEWATAEMDELFNEVSRLEAAWRSFLNGAVQTRCRGDLLDLGHFGTSDGRFSSWDRRGPTSQEAEAVALYMVFREMEAAVRGALPLPSADKLLLRVAGTVLSRHFDSVAEVEAAIASRSAHGTAFHASTPTFNGVGGAGSIGFFGSPPPRTQQPVAMAPG